MRDSLPRFGRAPLRWGDLVWLAWLTQPKSPSRLSISWLHQPTCRLKSECWLMVPADYRLGFSRH